MATEKKIKGVIIPRHDTAKNWAKAVNFIPNDGELIIYSKDSAEDLSRGYYLNDGGARLDSVSIGGKNYPVVPSDLVRFKFGNGTDNVNVLPFTTTDVDLSDYATEDWVENYVSEHGGGTIDEEYLVGKKTAEGGEIFNDYENNKAFGKYSHAGGSNTIAGQKAFTIEAMQQSMSATIKGISSPYIPTAFTVFDYRISEDDIIIYPTEIISPENISRTWGDFTCESLSEYNNAFKLSGSKDNAGFIFPINLTEKSTNNSIEFDFYFDNNTWAAYNFEILKDLKGKNSYYGIKIITGYPDNSTTIKLVPVIDGIESSAETIIIPSDIDGISNAVHFKYELNNNNLNISFTTNDGNIYSFSTITIENLSNFGTGFYIYRWNRAMIIKNLSVNEIGIKSDSYLGISNTFSSLVNTCIQDKIAVNTDDTNLYFGGYFDILDTNTFSNYYDALSDTQKENLLHSSHIRYTYYTNEGTETTDNAHNNIGYITRYKKLNDTTIRLYTNKTPLNNDDFYIAIDTSGKKIDGKYLDATGLDSEWNTLRFVTVPTLGNRNIGDGTFATGQNSIATSKFASALGMDNRSYGSYSFTGGSQNQAYFSSVALGRANSALGNISVALGYQAAAQGNGTVAIGSQVGAQYDKSIAIGGNGTFAAGGQSIAIGHGVKTFSNNQIVLGRYNVIENFVGVSDKLLIVGNGASNNNRKNAFVVNRDGSAVVDAQGNNDKSVVQKQYVDNSINNLDNVLKNILEAIQQGGTTTQTVAEIENIITDYLETKTVAEVEE